MAEQKTEKPNFRHLVRIVNTDLKGEKIIEYALRNIKGVSYQLSNAVCIVSKVPKNKKVGDLTDEEVKRIEAAILDPQKAGIPIWMLNRQKDPETGITSHLLSGDLEFTTDNDVKIMKKIKSYKGYRHAYDLPTRGQKTRSNFRKNKGKVQGVRKTSLPGAKPATDSGKKDKK